MRYKRDKVDTNVHPTYKLYHLAKCLFRANKYRQNGGTCDDESDDVLMESTKKKIKMLC